MEDKSVDMKEKEDKKKKSEEEKLPFCTTVGPEHARGDLDDEPCDDGRSGEE